MLSIRQLPPSSDALDHLFHPTPLGLRWNGQLAHDPELMLAGVEPTVEQALNLVGGFSPTGQRLLKAAGKQLKPCGDKPKPKADTAQRQARRVGFDLTIRAPVGLSMLFSVLGPAKRDPLLDAHRQAVDATLRFLEDQLRHRFIVLQADQANDPSGPALRTHNVVLTVSRVAGEWCAFNPRELYRHDQVAADFYLARLSELTPLG